MPLALSLVTSKGLTRMVGWVDADGDLVRSSINRTKIKERQGCQIEDFVGATLSKPNY